jgi:hypothetical protein
MITPVCAIGEVSAAPGWKAVRTPSATIIAATAAPSEGPVRTSAKPKSRAAAAVASPTA